MGSWILCISTKSPQVCITTDIVLLDSLDEKKGIGLDSNPIPQAKGKKGENRMPFTTVPLLRGFTEIEPLYNLTAQSAWIAGGYARYCASQNTKVVPAKDCDVFPGNQDSFDAIKYALIEKIGFEKSYENGVSLTLRTPKKKRENMDIRWRFCPQIQLIKPIVEGRVVTSGSIEDILNAFDFTITRAAIISPEEVLVDEDFIKDENNHLLKLKNIHCPISSMLRCMKYSKKGYWMRPSESLKLYLDWENRSPEYKSDMIELFKKSFIIDENGKQVKMSQKDIDELEALLRRD